MYDNNDFAAKQNKFDNSIDDNIEEANDTVISDANAKVVSIGLLLRTQDHGKQ